MASTPAQRGATKALLEETAAQRKVVRLEATSQRLVNDRTFLVQLIQDGDHPIVSRHRVMYGWTRIPFWTRKHRRASLHSLRQLTNITDLIGLLLGLMLDASIAPKKLDEYITQTPLSWTLRDKFSAAKRQYEARNEGRDAMLLRLIANPYLWVTQFATLAEAHADKTLERLYEAGHIDAHTWRELASYRFEYGPKDPEVLKPPVFAVSR